MSENSPMKQQRAFHPYAAGGKTRSSPLKSVQQHKHKEAPAPPRKYLPAGMNDVNFFSFSGGSSSLFPAQGRAAMSEMSNVQKQPLGNVTNKKVQPPVGTKPTNKDIGQSAPQPQPNRAEEVGVIGSRRPLPLLTTAKPNVTGFIPLVKSFTIWGDSSSSSNSNSIDAQVTSSENKPSSEVTAQENQQIPRTLTFRDGLNLMGVQVQAQPETAAAVETEIPRGVLTERKVAIYDFPEYSLDIYVSWLRQEKNQRSSIRPRYMERQPDISHKMRTILVDWVLEVASEYNFQEETIFLAVNLIDRCLSKLAIMRNKLQLIGSTALFIAAKYEELLAPEVGDVVYITDETYTKREILDMESLMLQCLEFKLMVPTAYDFVRILSTILLLNSQTTSLAMYLAELTLLDGERYLAYKPSVIATAAICFARYSFQRCFWDNRIQMYTSHGESEIKKCAENLLLSFYEAPTSVYSIIYDKYKSVQFNCVAQAIVPAILPWISKK